ncbi:hypothetical protein E2320_018066, partial [Naja naja]
ENEQDVHGIIEALNACLVTLSPATTQRVAHGLKVEAGGLFSQTKPDFLTPYTTAGTIQDYVVAMLCGREKPQMSVQNAASWGYFNTLEKSWNTKLLKDSGFPIHLLPEVVDSGDLAGETCWAWHQIPAGTKVGVALGDFQCSVYSCMSENSDAVLNIGTSAQLTVSMPPEFQPRDSPDPNSPVQYFPYFDNRYLAVAASLNGGNVMATFVKMVVGWMAELGRTFEERGGGVCAEQLSGFPTLSLASPSAFFRSFSSTST